MKPLSDVPTPVVDKIPKGHLSVVRKSGFLDQPRKASPRDLSEFTASKKETR